MFDSFCYIIIFVLQLQDIDFFQHLEMHMHSELPSLVGRDHLSFRSYYLPIKVFISVLYNYYVLYAHG